MSFAHWLNYLKNAQKESSLNGKSLRRLIYKFADGQEMIEEYNMETGLVERRAWRRRRQLMGEPEWEVEVGEAARQIINPAEPVQNIPDECGIVENMQTPILTKRITKQSIEWRIRNLPYPITVYSVRADAELRKIIISTTNKKYYKVLSVPELERCNIPPEQSRISVHHQYNTLIITYRKPDIVHEMEAQVLILLKDVPTEKGVADLMKQLMGQSTPQ